MARGAKLLTLGVLFAGLVGLPFFLTGYKLRFVTWLLMWVGLASTWNLFSGYTGYINFGPVAFFGVGAYVTAVLMVKAGVSFFPALLAAGVLAGIAALLLGVPTLRIRGAYFAIATLAFSEATRSLTLNLSGLTEGGKGLMLPIYNNAYFFYFVILGLTVAVVATVAFIQRTRFGITLVSIREDEVASQVLGVNTFLNKMAAFGLSGVFLALYGGIYAYWQTFIEPGEVFNVLYSVQMLVMTFLGGSGTLLGPIVGAVVLGAMTEYLWATFTYVYLIFVGVLIVATVLFLPDGVWGYCVQTQSRRRRRAQPAPVLE
ncbi:MAG: branched-chain amino acid ABC transporter permease [Candidatus Rokubacteria bacterium]|nr:branched-chain amino acid ABC transporter permease [Candidatus Rokubacteria bacterium]